MHPSMVSPFSTWRLSFEALPKERGQPCLGSHSPAPHDCGRQRGLTDLLSSPHLYGQP